MRHIAELCVACRRARREAVLGTLSHPPKVEAMAVTEARTLVERVMRQLGAQVDRIQLLIDEKAIAALTGDKDVLEDAEALKQLRLVAQSLTALAQTWGEMTPAQEAPKTQEEYIETFVGWFAEKLSPPTQREVLATLNTLVGPDLRSVPGE